MWFLFLGFWHSRLKTTWMIQDKIYNTFMPKKDEQLFWRFWIRTKTNKGRKTKHSTHLTTEASECTGINQNYIKLPIHGTIHLLSILIHTQNLKLTVLQYIKFTWGMPPYDAPWCQSSTCSVFSPRHIHIPNFRTITKGIHEWESEKCVGP